MRLPRLAIESHQFTIVVVLLLLALGVVSFFTMPRSEDPPVSPAGASVFVIYPGATPTDIEELINDPLESALNELDDIDELVSYAEDGIGTVTIQFEEGSDPDKKYSDVVDKVNSVRNQLPDGILTLELVKHSVADVNILQIALISNTESYAALESIAEKLQKELKRCSGVRRVEATAFPEQRIRVSLDFKKMAAYHISISQIMGAIQAANQTIPGGFLDIGSRRFNIQTGGDYQSIDDIRNTVVHAAGGKVVYLQDVADIDFGYADAQYFARVNGVPAVFVTVQQKPGTNIFKVMKSVKSKTKLFQANLPGSIKLAYVFDQSASVSKNLNGFFVNLLQGLFLVGIVVLVAVSYRAAAIVILVIPLSILFGIGFIDLSGYGLQQMTIAGLVIAIGLLVDNAIVVTDNISRFMQKGYSKFEAASQGASQIAWAVVSSTITTVLAFVPMILMRDITGEFIRSMPLIVVYTLTASLFLSLTLTPYLSSRFLDSEKMSHRLVRRTMERIVATTYRRSLDRALKHPALVLITALLFFLASFALIPLVGVSFFPKAEKPQFMIDVVTPNGSSLDETDHAIHDVENVLADMKNVKYYVANIGHGNPRIYYNLFPKRSRSRYGQIYVELREFDIKSFEQSLAWLRLQFADYPNAQVKVRELEQGPYIAAPVLMRLVGDDLSVLQKLSRDVESMFRATPGVININNTLSSLKTDLYVKINRDKAGLLGVPPAEIERAVRVGMTGLPVTRYRDEEGKSFDVVVRLPVGGKPTVEDFSNIYVTSLAGVSIPLLSLATIEFKTTPMMINHFDMQRNAAITSDVVSGYSAEDVGKEIIKKLDHYNFPPGYRYVVGGELQGREESFGGMYKSIIIALIGIFAVLVLQFKSYTQPIIVFSAIPLALIGSVLMLLITGYSFSFTAFVGLTSLVGIVVNNSIILVDYTNQLRRDNVSLHSALTQACETRFIPIILTTATTIGGLLPLTLIGGSLWAPMGWTIIGGLLMSTVLTLLVVPVLYKVLSSSHKPAK